MAVWVPIIVAVISAAGSFLGVYYSNRKSAVASAALIDYRIRQLEEEVRKHNNLIDRMYKVEEQQKVHTEQLKVANHRIDDLEHKTA